MPPLVILFPSPSAIFLPALSIIFWHEKDCGLVSRHKVYYIWAGSWNKVLSNEFTLQCEMKSICSLLKCKEVFHHLFKSSVCPDRRHFCTNACNSGKKEIMFSEGQIFIDKTLIKAKVLRGILNILNQRWTSYILSRHSRVRRLPLCRKLLCPKYATASWTAYQFKGLQSSTHVMLFFLLFFQARKIQQQYEINHNVLYQPLWEIARKRAVMTGGLGAWKNGARCHKANSL